MDRWAVESIETQLLNPDLMVVIDSQEGGHDRDDEFCFPSSAP
jgi:hypothetical protein